MPGLNELLAKAGQEMVSEGAAKTAEPFIAAILTGSAAVTIGPLIMGIAIKEAISFIVGPLFMHIFAVTDHLDRRTKALELRVDRVEQRLERRPMQAQELLALKIKSFANVSNAAGADEILYMRSQVGLAAMQVEHEMLNAEKLGELDHFGAELLLGIAASLQSGGSATARRHLQVCVDKVMSLTAKLQEELVLSQDERSRPPYQRKKREEITRYFRDMEIGTGRFKEVDDGVAAYWRRDPEVVQRDIDDQLVVAKYLKAVLKGLPR